MLFRSGLVLFSSWNTPGIPAAEKNKAPVPEVAEEEDEEGQVLRKLKPKIPDHNYMHDRVVKSGYLYLLLGYVGY